MKQQNYSFKVKVISEFFVISLFFKTEIAKNLKKN